MCARLQGTVTPQSAPEPTIASASISTSMSGSMRARTSTIDVTGRVVPKTVSHRGDTLHFRVSDRNGGESMPVVYSGTVPDPFRGGREIVLTGEVDNGKFMGDRDTLVTKCPSKFTEEKNS